MVSTHRSVFVSVAFAAVSQSPPYISAKLSADEADGMAKMMNSATITVVSTGIKRRTSSMTPRAAKGLTTVSYTHLGAIRVSLSR